MASILVIGGVCRPNLATSVRTAWLALRTVPTSSPSQHLLADGQPHRPLAESGRGNITTSAYLHDEASQLEVTSRKFGSQARFIDVQTPTEVFATAINDLPTSVNGKQTVNKRFKRLFSDKCYLFRHTPPIRSLRRLLLLARLLAHPQRPQFYRHHAWHLHSINLSHFVGRGEANDLLAWWKKNEHNFPIIAAMARDSWPSRGQFTKIRKRKLNGWSLKLDGAGHRMPIKIYLPTAMFPVVVEQYQHLLPLLSLLDASGRAGTRSER
ncbi:hypothetical protein B0H19DRAFT_1307972 [Mycena capillaripes]|nr:hypothetical protein B0H19DRAFT_1307972 [Mycena capillaripes]